MKRGAWGATVVAVLLLSGCTWLTERSLTVRALLWLDADMGDIHRFPMREIPGGRGCPLRLPPRSGRRLRLGLRSSGAPE